MVIYKDFWGPHLWIFLHSIAMNYPEKPTKLDMYNMKNYIFSLAEILPCEGCKKHFKKVLVKGYKKVP